MTCEVIGAGRRIVQTTRKNRENHASVRTACERCVGEVSWLPLLARRRHLAACPRQQPPLPRPAVARTDYCLVTDGSGVRAEGLGSAVGLQGKFSDAGCP
jgi:hypothetical protein